MQEREADRMELAHALHDEAAQTLANVALHLQICERALAVDVERGRAELANARAAIGEAINRLRGQVFRLRPLTLEEVGVAQTLKRYVATLPARDDLTVEVVDGLGATRLDPQTELGLYRIAQALIDAAAQSAGRVAVEVRADGLELRADKLVVPWAVREWVAALGGQLDLEESAVKVLVPVR